jgi:flagellar assembly protein FliH
MTEPARSEAFVLRNLRLHAAPLTLRRRTDAPADVHVSPQPVIPPGPSLEQQLAEAYERGIAVGRSSANQDWEQRDGQLLEAERARVRAEAEARGLEEGRALAGEELRLALQRQEERAQGLIKEQIERLEHLAGQLAALQPALLADAEDELVALVHATLCRMLGAQAASPDVVRSCARQLMEGTTGQPLALHVHPDDFAALQADGAGGESHVCWVADPAVRLGGVLLRSDSRTVDARLETQMQQLGEVLLQVRSGRHQTPPGTAA